MSEEINRNHEEHATCGHCHGEGHTECQTCHGKGEETCPECGGKKEVKCSKCKGHGEFSDCKRCYSTGKVDCSQCGGTGRVREKCHNCRGSGRVERTRLRRCRTCGGRGEVESGARFNSGPVMRKCSHCNGTGEEEETYRETCPTCGGSGKGYEITCPNCNGKKEFTCSRCHGTGRAECQECSGTGKVTCSTCSGDGSVVCHDCHGGGDHVCVECYGTGDKLPVLENKNVKKVDAAIEFYKKKEYVNAFLTFREAVVKHNNAAALRRLGGMYERGEAIYKNLKRANLLYCAAANAGDVVALFHLGKNYLEGVGVDANSSEARRLLELATVKGHADAESEYKKVAKAKLVKHALSGVVGWRGKFEIPKFLLEADPAADQKDKDEKEAARKAEEARKERERKRKIRNINLCRGLWWFLFRVAAAGVYFACLKDCYRDIPDDAVTLLAVGFFVASYIIRPKFGGGVCYFLVGLALPIAALVCNSTNPMASFCLFTVMVTFFMRWMGEKLKFPFLTYPLVGAMVGFCTSPFAISHNVYNVTPWWFSVMGLSILFFFVNMGMSGNNGNGVVAKGARKTSWAGTFWILGICGIATWYIFASVKGEQYKFGWVPSEKSVSEKSETPSEDLSAGNGDGTYEKGVDCLKRKELEEAVKWFKMAAENGDARAIDELKRLAGNK